MLKNANSGRNTTASCKRPLVSRLTNHGDSCLMQYLHCHALFWI